jgi:hypothetical protein
MPKGLFGIATHDWYVVDFGSGSFNAEDDILELMLLDPADRSRTFEINREDAVTIAKSFNLIHGDFNHG